MRIFYGLIYSKIGDIIVLKKEEKCPADILILDSNEDYVLISNSETQPQGNTSYKTVYPLKMTFGTFLRLILK